MRLLAIDNFVVLASLLPSSVVAGHVLPLVLQLGDDKSWRVRWSVANQIISLCEAFTGAAARAKLLESFTSLLQVRPAPPPSAHVVARSRAAFACCYVVPV